MAHTERRRIRWNPDGTVTIDPSARDAKGRCWCCSGWKRPDRRQRRHTAKAQLRRNPERA